MVADAKNPAKKTDRQRTRGRFREIPILVRLKARNLYLIQGLSHTEIAEQTGLSRQSSEALAHREGWVKDRRERAKRLTAKADARMESLGNEALESIAQVSEQHAMRGLGRVGEALESHDDFAARNFQSWTGGVKNLVSIMRDIRAPEAQPGAGANLNVFVLRVGDAVQPALQATSQRIEKNVTPCEVSGNAGEKLIANDPSLNKVDTVAGS